MKIKVREYLCLVEMYDRSRTKEADLATALLNMKGKGGYRVIITVNLNVRDRSWDTCTNARCRTVLKFAGKWKYQVTTTEEPTYKARGNKGGSNRTSS